MDSEDFTFTIWRDKSAMSRDAKPRLRLGLAASSGFSRHLKEEYGNRSDFSTGDSTSTGTVWDIEVTVTLPPSRIRGHA